MKVRRQDVVFTTAAQDAVGRDPCFLANIVMPRIIHFPNMFANVVSHFNLLVFRQEVIIRSELDMKGGDDT